MLTDTGAIVLAGGASRRMGRDKALLPWNGQPLIAHVVAQVRQRIGAIVISASDTERYAFLGLPVVRDREPGQGPLMGLASCLAAAPGELHLLVGCDMPWLPLPVIDHLFAQADGVDAVVRRDEAGHPEPLCAVYRRTCLPVAEALLAQGRRRMTDLLAEVRVHWVAPSALSDAGRVANLNTPADYQAALSEVL